MKDTSLYERRSEGEGEWHLTYNWKKKIPVKQQQKIQVKCSVKWSSITEDLLNRH